MVSVSALQVPYVYGMSSAWQVSDEYGGSTSTKDSIELPRTSTGVVRCIVYLKASVANSHDHRARVGVHARCWQTTQVESRDAQWWVIV